ncbi:MAG: class I tRNA ligase family protein, partial [Clostridia bacterium]|nr:class I tRNA ligase family protein [Clostridia bacterium]
TAIARLMELTNALYAFKPSDDVGRELQREAVDALLNCLSPFSPHIAEELWQMLGNDSLLSKAPWPVYEEDALTADSVTIVVQVNGKIRDKFGAAPDTPREELEKTARSLPGIQKWTEGKAIVKVIAVPGKLVNIVLR